MAAMKVRFTNRHGVPNIKGYVDEEPDPEGLHHGVAEASDRLIVVRWDGERWIET